MLEDAVAEEAAVEEEVEAVHVSSESLAEEVVVEASEAETVIENVAEEAPAVEEVAAEVELSFKPTKGMGSINELLLKSLTTMAGGVIMALEVAANVAKEVSSLEDFCLLL